MLTFDGEMTAFRAKNKKTLVNKAHFCYVPMRVTNSVFVVVFSSTYTAKITTKLVCEVLKQNIIHREQMTLCQNP